MNQRLLASGCCEADAKDQTTGRSRSRWQWTVRERKERRRRGSDKGEDQRGETASSAPPPPPPRRKAKTKGRGGGVGGGAEGTGKGGDTKVIGDPRTSSPYTPDPESELRVMVHGEPCGVPFPPAPQGCPSWPWTPPRVENWRSL